MKILVFLSLLMVSTVVLSADEILRQLPTKPVSQGVRDHAQKKKTKKMKKKKKKENVFEHMLKNSDKDEDGNNAALAAVLRELHEAQAELMKRNRQLEGVIEKLVYKLEEHEAVMGSLMSKINELNHDSDLSTNKDYSLDELQVLLGLAS